jgi:hypothetical protein
VRKLETGCARLLAAGSIAKSPEGVRTLGAEGPSRLRKRLVQIDSVSIPTTISCFEVVDYQPRLVTIPVPVRGGSRSS